MTYEELVQQFTSLIFNAYLSSIRTVSNDILLNELVKQIELNNANAAFETLGLDAASLNPFLRTINDAYEQGGIYAAAGYPKYIPTPTGKVVFRFDVRNPRAEKYLKDKSSDLITSITDDARVNVRNALSNGIDRGRSPKSVALDIAGRYDSQTKQRVGGIVGLTTGQDGWVRNTRVRLENLDQTYLNLKLRDRRFDGIVEKAITDGKALDDDTIDKLVTRYTDNVLKYRAETIARTETLQSLSVADYESMQQLIDRGSLTQNDIELEWDDTADRRTRPEHRHLNGQRVKYGTPFVTSKGHRMLHPHDTSLGATAEDVVQCRCRVRKHIDFFAAVV